MTKTQTDTTFVLRQYGKSELALLYFPHLTQQSAWRKLNRWISLNPTLRQQLEGYELRTFTPRQVALIVEQLGEP